MAGNFTKLRKQFAPSRLQSDLNTLCRIKGVPAGYPGEGHEAWTSVSLFPPGQSDLLRQTPYFREVLEELNCTLRLVRLMVLEPGGVIKEHCDSFLTHDVVRLHIPIVTHPDVDAFIGGERCDWKEGELWYGDFSLPHSAVNRSPVTRVHQVLDVLLDDALLGLFPPDELPRQAAIPRSSARRAEKSGQALERFVFSFVLPVGFKLHGTPYEPLRAPLPGSVQLIHGELNVCVNDQPMLKAVPSADDTLDLVGLPCDARIFCRYGSKDEKVVGATLAVGADGARIALDVTAP